MKLDFEKPLYPYLYGLALIAYKSARYFPSFSVIPAFVSFLVFCFFCYILTLALNKIKPSPYVGIATVILLISLFHIAAIAQFLGYEYAATPWQFYAVFYPLTFVFVIGFLLLVSKIEYAFAATFNKTINVFLVVVSTVFLANGFVYARKTYWHNERRLGLEKKIPSNKQQDIIWFLFDEYPSSLSLKQQFGFDNPMEKLLADDGFMMLDSMKSRFNNTLFSLNAIFNMDDSIAPTNFYAGVRSLKQNAWINQLDSSGYEVVNLGFFDLNKHPMLADRSGYPQTYLQQLISGSLINVVVNETKYSIAKCDQYASEILQKLDDTLCASSDRRRFIWVHLPIPHEPFCRDKEGHLYSARDVPNMVTDTDIVKKYFVDYLEYGNGVLTGLLKNHRELFQKIVVVTGDHGPRYSFLKNKDFQKWPVAAIRIPVPYDTMRLKRLRYISQLPAFLMQHLSGQMN